MVRPRYEVSQGGRTRIAHLNVERADLRPNPEIKSLHNLLGRGYLLPFPVLPPERFRSIVLPTPMAETQANLPLRLDVFGAEVLAISIDHWVERVGQGEQLPGPTVPRRRRAPLIGVCQQDLVRRKQEQPRMLADG